jgi:leucyl/phenylalanyl-tRNA--protein transferase
VRIAPRPSAWAFPDPADAEPGIDVLAVGADLDPSTVFAAYEQGMFPMHLDTGELAWWSPDPRGILPLDGLKVSRSLRRSLSRFVVTTDTAFADVMRACADGRREGAWITDDFIAAYSELHRLGWAHSVEAWTPAGQLAGGLYGIEIGGLFAGESMFHRERDASKAALVELVSLLRAGGGDRVLDVQWRTDHLGTLGAVEIPRLEYLELLGAALLLEPCLGAD